MHSTVMTEPLPRACSLAESLLCGKSFNQDACQALWECLLHARQGDKYFAYLRSIDIHCNSDGSVTDPILQERPPRCKSPP